MKEVTDPGLLEQLNGGGAGKPVSDPALLAQLNAPAGTRESRMAQIPGMTPEVAPAPDKSTLMDKVKGVGETAAAAVTGVPAAWLGSVAGFGTAVAKGETAGSKSAKEVFDRVSSSGYQPKTEKGKEYTENFGRALDATGIAGLGPMALPMARAAAPAVKQGARAAAASPEADLLRKGAQKVGDMGPKIAPDTRALAQKAQEIGIPLRPDMLSKNPLLRMAGEASEKVPLAGAKTAERHEAFNRAVMKTIGADEKTGKLTPDVFDKAITASGEKIGEIAGKTSIPLDGELQGALAQYVERAAKFETEDVAKVVRNYVEEFAGKAENGAVPGEAYRKLNSQIGRQARSTANGDLKNVLGELQDAMHEALVKQLSGEDLAAFQEARQRYAIAKTLEPLVAKSETGDISPAALMQAVTGDKSKKSQMARGRGGDIGELARIGQRFLKEPKSSGTAERNLVYGAIGGGATALNPALGAGIYGAANLYNRASPWMARKMTGEPKADKAMQAVGATP